MKHVSSSIRLILLAFVLSACAVPNIENPRCREAQDFLKKFYSFHFGNEMRSSAENLDKRKEFLTGELQQQLARQNPSAFDYFTQTEDYPKAFRVGACEAVGEEKILTDILLFWKDDTRSEQREIRVEVVKENENWSVNQVQNK